MSDLDELYREIILDHYRSPRNRGELAVPPAHVVQGFNPLCGDEINLYLLLANGALEELSVTGQGCSISQSSASLMSVAVKGQPLEEVRNLQHEVLAMLGLEEVTGLGRDLGELGAIAGVMKFPARLKCAALPWTTLARGLDELLAATASPTGD